MTGVHCSCCSGAHSYPVEVAVDAMRWQTVISAFSTPMLCFLSPQKGIQWGAPFLLCSLPPRTAPHGASSSRRCTHYKGWVSQQSCPIPRQDYSDFHFVHLELAHWQPGSSARAEPCLQGPPGRAWMWLWGHSSMDSSSYKRRYHPAFCHLYRFGSCISISLFVFPTYFTLVKVPPWPPLPCPSMYSPYSWGKPQVTISYKLSFEISSAWLVQDNSETGTLWFMRNDVNTWKNASKTKFSHNTFNTQLKASNTLSPQFFSELTLNFPTKLIISPRKASDNVQHA